MTTPPLRTGCPAPGDQAWDDWLRHLGDNSHMSPERPLVAMRKLRPGIGSPMAARNVTKITLTEWGLGGLYEDAAVIVSELATNAIRHGLTDDPGEFLKLILVRYRNHFVCMVIDPADTPPLMQEADHIAEGGRGLHIIDAMSRAWGWTPLPSGGKAVWAALAIS
jgi:Histidine kinase-like ATPase domain